MFHRFTIFAVAPVGIHPRPWNLTKKWNSRPRSSFKSFQNDLPPCKVKLLTNVIQDDAPPSKALPQSTLKKLLRQLPKQLAMKSLLPNWIYPNLHLSGGKWAKMASPSWPVKSWKFISNPALEGKHENIEGLGGMLKNIWKRTFLSRLVGLSATRHHAASPAGSLEVCRCQQNLLPPLSSACLLHGLFSGDEGRSDYFCELNFVFCHTVTNQRERKIERGRERHANHKESMFFVFFQDRHSCVE